jgi:hypothetical protein
VSFPGPLPVYLGGGSFSSHVSQLNKKTALALNTHCTLSETFRDTRLKIVLPHRGRKTLQGLACGGAFHARANMRFPLGPGLPQDRRRAEGFRINSRDQVDIPRSVFLPKLANLDFRYAHRSDNGSTGFSLCQRAAKRDVRDRPD